MAFDNQDDSERLQKLVKSSLLEINKLKMEILQLKEKQNFLIEREDYERLKEESEEALNEKDMEISDLKSKTEEALKIKDEEVSSIKSEARESLLAKDSELSAVKEESAKTIQNRDDEISDLRIKLQESIRNQESLLEKDNEILKLKAEATVNS